MPEIPSHLAGLIPTTRAPASVNAPPISPHATISSPAGKGTTMAWSLAVNASSEIGTVVKELAGAGGRRVPAGRPCRDRGLNQRRDDVAELVAVPPANLGGDPGLLGDAAAGKAKAMLAKTTSATIATVPCSASSLTPSALATPSHRNVPGTQSQPRNGAGAASPSGGGFGPAQRAGAPERLPGAPAFWAEEVGSHPYRVRGSVRGLGADARIGYMQPRPIAQPAPR